ncbi:MAG: endospore germination permease [Clostridia bacterium]|nr:endospore germination permease [Clostridia bacterium]MDD4386400.1 endospore germination permease [Clostridia bacterium]
MSNDNGKISVRQFFLLFIVLFCAPAIRYLPLGTIQDAHNAAWISPLVTGIFIVVYTFIWIQILKKYERQSFIDITKDIIGKTLGSIVCIVYFLWITFMLAYNVEMYTVKLVSTAMIGINPIMISSVMMILIVYVVKSGIIPLAKMNEIFFAALIIIFIVCNFLILPQIQLQNLFPITYKDIIPIFKANFSGFALFSYIIVLFMFNDKVEHKGEFKKVALNSLLLLIIISILTIAIPICIFGADIIVKMPVPYLNTMMQISVFNVIERIESAIIIFWVITDFVMFAIFTYSAMHMIKVFYKLDNVKPLINIYIVGIFFLSLSLATSTIELKILSNKILTNSNILMGSIVPILIFGIGKLRKKI